MTKIYDREEKSQVWDSLQKKLYLLASARLQPNASSKRSHMGSLDVDEQLRRVRRQEGYTEEVRLMELLADEEVDEERFPDDRELEGSGDDFTG